MHIPIIMARFCLDCEAIHDQLQCPSCTSYQWHPLQDWVKPIVQTRPAATEMMKRSEECELEPIFTLHKLVPLRTIQLT